MCSSCDPFDTEITIHGPAQLRRIVTKLREAVRSRILHCTPIESDRALIDQEPFLELDLDEYFPDVMIYNFRCDQCGTAFGLQVETYHGQGGTWSKL